MTDIANFLSDPDRGLFLGIPAVLAIAALAWGLVWTSRRLSRLPSRPRPRQSVGHQRLDLSEEREVVPPTRLELILREDAASRPMTCEEARAYFGLDAVHDVFEEDDRG